MKKILITGGDGFIARSIAPLLKKEGHFVYAPGKEELDLLNLESVWDYFSSHEYFDVVIHAAVQGGRRYNFNKEPQVALNNLLMFENLMTQQHDHFGLLINLGSGAEFDKSRAIFNIREDCLCYPPTDAYSFSKYLISKMIRRCQYSNIITLRIFSTFGTLEANDRFIKANLLNYINGRDIVIFKDQLISFMSVIDIYKVINYFILKRSSYKALYECCDYNLVYPKQYRTLAIIADQINHLEDGKKSRIIIDNTSSNTPDYHGNGDKLKELNIDLIGFDKSLKMMYEELKKEEINET